MTLFTGTGRCGTGYVARLLTEAGYECGHEEVWGLGDYRSGLGEFVRMDRLEASWLGLSAVAWASQDRRDGCVVHIRRDPVDVARSLARTQVMADLDNGYGRVHADMLPALRWVDCPLARGWLWIGWVHGVLQDVPYWDVSEPVSRLAVVAGLDVRRLERAAERVPKDVNTRPRNLPRWWREPV